MPKSFRIVCGSEHVGLVEELLQAEGHVFAQEPFHPLARRVLEEPTPLGASAAAAFGLIYIQDRSSMLAPLLLGPPPQGVVLDMCASPGSKTGLLAQLVGPEGMVLANEANPRRLATLRQNMAALNLPQVVTCGRPGQELPIPESRFASIQLDPPCSGWGTVERNPRVREMWPEQKLGPLISLQRALLHKAATLLAPGGRLLYSTCTTNPAENREQVQWATEQLGLFPAELPFLPGFDQSRILDESDDGCLQIQTETGEGQGFFYAALTRSVASPPAPGHFEEPSNTTRASSGGFALKGQWTAGRKRGEGAKVSAGQPGIVMDPGTLPGLQEAAWERLPPGQVREFSGRVFFLPEHALTQGLDLPSTLGWRGFELGRLGARAVRLNPRLRLLLPEYAPGRGLNLDEAHDIQKMLQGQSLPLPSGSGGGGRIGLYWRGLPLGWATRKGERCLWSPK